MASPSDISTQVVVKKLVATVCPNVTYNSGFSKFREYISCETEMSYHE